MAIGYSNIPTGEANALSADKPLLVCNNIISDYNAAAEWRESGSWTSGSDITDSNYPTSNLHDGHLHRVSKPGSSTTNTVYVIFDLNVGSDDAHTYDVLAILGHNFQDMVGDITVYMDLSDVADFSSVVLTRTISPSSAEAAGRVVVMKLPGTGSGERFWNVRYVRLGITSSTAGAFSVLPEIGEVVMGKRIQLSYKTEHPYSDDDAESLVAEFVSESGARSAYVKRKGQAVFRGKFLASDSSGAFGIDDIQQWKDFWTLSGQGTKPFLYVPNPYSGSLAGDGEETVNGYWVRMREPAFRFPFTGPHLREVEVELDEVPPFVSQE